MVFFIPEMVKHVDNNLNTFGVTNLNYSGQLSRFLYSQAISVKAGLHVTICRPDLAKANSHGTIRRRDFLCLI